MEIIERHISNNYFRQLSNKIGLMIHGTAGNMPGAEEWLNFKTEKVNVPFILLRNGDINEYFKPKYWAYHTGVGKCRNYIPLEIENWVNLTLTDGYFLPWTKEKKQAVAPERVLTVNNFRGYEYFEMLTHKQLISLDQWFDYILDLFPCLIEFTTHAEVNQKKLDFPPDFFQVYDIINKYRAIVEKNSSEEECEIVMGEELNYTKEKIQNRINWLIKNIGWKSPELNRLVAYRDRFLN